MSAGRLQMHYREFVDSKRLPRLVTYLSRLPSGFDSYPESVARGSLSRIFVDDAYTLKTAAAISWQPLAGLFSSPPTCSSWIPEVHGIAMLLAIADCNQLTETELVNWVLVLHRHAFRHNLIFRVITMLASPALILSGASSRWKSLHNGSTLTAIKRSSNETDMKLQFKPFIFHGFLSSLAVIFQAVLEMSPAVDVNVRLVSFDSQEALYRMSWK